MKDEVYEYLISYGFNKDDLNKIDDNNENMYFASLNKVKENIVFLKNKGLNNNEIINIIKSNPFMLTLSIKRKNAFEEIYTNRLNLSNKEIKYLLNINDNLYTCSPIELNEIINYLYENKCNSTENIRQIILSNPNIINKKLDYIKEYI